MKETMVTKTRIILFFLLLLIGIAFLVRFDRIARKETNPPRKVSLLRETYRQLDRIRQKKRNQLERYLARLQHLAARTRNDTILLESFRLLHRYHVLGQKTSPPPDALKALQRLRQRTLQYFLQNYRGFYNILFVAPDGTVFHTVPRMDYRGKPLFAGALGRSTLARRLQKQGGEAFVDFEYSKVSREPSAFFVEPVRENGQFGGWFILQCSINNINDIFVREATLGRTGEVFLVNQECQMLTDSRFRADSSILNLHLSPENIRGKFAEGRGHKIVTDYRGFRALTSFEVCSTLGSQWLLIAKIDEAEVLTDHYQRHRDEFHPTLTDVLSEPARSDSSPFQAPKEATLVDMDEFRRAKPREQLLTYGVDTCTAVVIHIPGEFAYMGHASNYDSLYGGEAQDLVRNMMQRIRTYEIPPYRRRYLQVAVVAPHRETIIPAINKLVDQGILLTQIRFMHNPNARSATVWHDVASGRTHVAWKPNQKGQPNVYQTDNDVPRIGDLMRKPLTQCNQ